ncbi:hypothetical protein BVX97_05480, partial [bacterium E08(2017)]
MRQKRSFLRPSILTILVILFTGCASHNDESDADVTWVDLIGQLTSPDMVARLDTLDSKLISSADPTRGNKDYNHFVRMERVDGQDWIVIADIKGSGYVSRYWCTGTNNREHPIRFYFNNEKKPRLITHYKEFFGGKAPYLAPLANREQGCWYSYIPISFSERLVIMILAKDTISGQTVRDYHHLNYSVYTNGTTVQTFPKEIKPEHTAALEKARIFWSKRLKGPGDPPTESTLTTTNETVIPGGAIQLDQLNGPASISRLEIEPDFDAVETPAEKEKLLRDLQVRITWNGSAKPSVDVPIGDLFGSYLRRTRFSTMYVGMTTNTFFTSFPMPFEKSADISIHNNSKHSVPISIKAYSSKIDSWDDNLGYFHAAWSKSGAEQKGKPHIMLQTKGSGKYVGCFLSVTSRDKSWWALESNDYIYTDSDSAPSWQGTGLEDYFNGGWYYKNAKVQPLSGLLFHVPFKTVQYRLHMTDPVHFSDRIYFEFERGPNHVSRAIMESIVYYYMDKPSSSIPRIPEGLPVYEARTELEQHTLMRELNNQDYVGDLIGAKDHIDEYLERYPDYEHKEMLLLRRLAYR